jgi:hypothetical protein
MSFSQRSQDDTPGVVADSFFTPSPLQYLSRRHIMSLSVKVAAIVGLASDSLFGAVSADIIVQDEEKNVATMVLLYLEDRHYSIIEFPAHYYAFCSHSDLPVRATA